MNLKQAIQKEFDLIAAARVGIFDEEITINEETLEQDIEEFFDSIFEEADCMTNFYFN